MKILILDAYYPSFLNQFNSSFPFENLTFDEHRNLLMSQRMGTSDVYSFWLNQIGHDAMEVPVNYDSIQLKWATERGIRIDPASGILDRIFGKLFKISWRYKIILEQVKHYKPDILYIQEGNILSDEFIKEMKQFVPMIIGQLASPIPRGRSYRHYDLVLSSFPHFVEMFKKKGISSEYFKLGFDSRIIGEIGENPRTIPVSFVGGYDRAHGIGTEILEAVGDAVPVQFYGYGVEKLGKESPVQKHYYGEVWGLDMYAVLSKSRITLNRHINASERFANNMRLYEATGMGCCLVTDWKENLSDIFDPNGEIVVYSSKEECVEKVKWLLDHPADCLSIAEKGRARVLKEHTYKQRVSELNDIIKTYWKK